MELSDEEIRKMFPKFADYNFSPFMWFIRESRTAKEMRPRIEIERDTRLKDASPDSLLLAMKYDYYREMKESGVEKGHVFGNIPDGRLGIRTFHRSVFSGEYPKDKQIINKMCDWRRTSEGYKVWSVVNVRWRAVLPYLYCMLASEWDDHLDRKQDDDLEVRIMDKGLEEAFDLYIGEKEMRESKEHFIYELHDPGDDVDVEQELRDLDLNI